MNTREITVTHPEYRGFEITVTRGDRIPQIWNATGGGFEITRGTRKRLFAAIDDVHGNVPWIDE